MNNNDFIKNAVRTESKDYDSILKRLESKQNIRLLHAGIGFATESGEFLDMIKKHIYYGKELDIVNLKEEIGDIFWYIAVVCDELEICFEELMIKNILKLKQRYPEKFTKEDCENRNLEKERTILEFDLKK